LRESPKIKI